MAESQQTLTLPASGTSRVELPYWFRQLLRHRLSVVGGAYIIIVIIAGLLAPLIAPYDPAAFDLPNRLAGPSVDHWLGADYLGRDAFSRLLYGARVSIIVGMFSVVIAALIGVPLGLIAAYFGGWVDHGIMRFIDAKMAIPGVILAILLLLVLGGGIVTVSIALGINLSSAQARLIRSQALSVKEREYFSAARAMGVASWRLIFLHMMPNSIQPVIVQASLGVGFAVLGEASLSFLGVGVPPDTPTWGNMLKLSFDNIRSAGHLTYAPGIAIFLLVLAFSFVGDGLRDVLDPRLKGKI